MKKYIICFILAIFSFNLALAAIPAFSSEKVKTKINDVVNKESMDSIEAALGQRETYFTEGFKDIEEFVEENVDEEDVAEVMALTEQALKEIVAIVDEALKDIENGESVDIDSLYRQIATILVKYGMNMSKYVNINDLMKMINELSSGLEDLVDKSDLNQYFNEDTYDELMKVISSREDYLSEGLTEISTYIDDNLIEGEQEEVQALTKELMADIEKLMVESLEDLENGDSVNMPKLEKELMILVSRYLFKINKYVDVDELVKMIEDFVAGFNNLLVENQESRSLIASNTYKQRETKYELLYSKLEKIIKKYPVDQADDVLIILEKKLYTIIAQTEGSDSISDEKKAKMLELYNVLLWVVQDMQDGYNINLNDLEVISVAFDDGDNIPSKYTCEGENISPQLKIKNISSDGKYLALIMDDPDAPKGTWDHYLLINITANGVSLNIEENSVPAGAVVGKNSSGKTLRAGPCPPSGEHRYFFKVYEFDKKLDLETGFSKEEFLKEFEKYGIGYGEMVGLYEKGQ